MEARIRQRVEGCYNSGCPVPPNNLQQAIDDMVHMSENSLNDELIWSLTESALINTNLRNEYDGAALTMVGKQVRWWSVEVFCTPAGLLAGRFPAAAAGQPVALPLRDDATEM